MTRPTASLLLLLALQLAANAIWLSHDATPLGFEVPEHWLAVRVAADDLRANGDVLGWIWRHRRIGHRPAAIHLAVAGHFAGRPDASPAVATWTLGALTLALLAWSSWRLGEALATGAGPLAGAFVLLLPATWGFSRKLGVDLPAAALFLAFCASMVANPPWERTRAVARLGLLAGLACLVRAQLALWIGALACVSAFEDLPRKTAAKQLSLFALCAALGSAPFWAGSPAEMMELVDDVRWSAVGPHTEADGWALGYYPRGLMTWIGAALGAMTLGGCLAWTKDGHGYRPGAKTLFIALLLGLLPWLFYRVRWVRYVLPLMPPLLVLGAAGMMRMPYNGRRALVSLGLGLAILAEVSGSAGLAIPDLLRAEPAVELCHRPTAIDWPASARDLSRKLRRRDHLVVGLVGPQSWQPDHYTIFEWALRRHLPPSARIYRASDRRDPEDAREFARARPEMTLLIHVLRHANPPSLPGGWRRGRAIALLDFDSDVAWRVQADELSR